MVAFINNKMFANIKLENLDLTFEGEKVGENAFGPSSNVPEHISAKYDGKIFKPYSKKEKLGKLCEFTLIPTQGGGMIASMAHAAQKEKKVISSANVDVIADE